MLKEIIDYVKMIDTMMLNVDVIKCWHDDGMIFWCVDVLIWRCLGVLICYMMKRSCSIELYDVVHCRVYTWYACIMVSPIWHYECDVWEK